MDTGAWQLPDELAMLRDTVRKFMAEVVRPLEDTLTTTPRGRPMTSSSTSSGEPGRSGCGRCRRPRSSAAPG